MSRKQRKQLSVRAYNKAQRAKESAVSVASYNRMRKAEARSMLRDGWTKLETANMLGVSVRTLRRILAR